MMQRMKFAVGLLLFAAHQRHVAVVASEECPICMDGSEMTAPLDTIAVDYPEEYGTDGTRPFWASCGDLLEKEPSEDCDCACMQLAAAARCGCETAPDLACDLCFDGSLPTLIDRPVGNTGMKCFDILMMSMEEDDVDECEENQEMAAEFCGCGVDAEAVFGNADEEESCSFCPGNFGLQVEPAAIESFMEGLDCNVVSVASLEAVSDDDCTGFQSISPYCECDSYEVATEDPSRVCRLCGDNTLLPRPFAMVSEEEPPFLTCGAVEYMANTLTEESDPEDWEKFSECATLREKYAYGCCLVVESNEDGVSPEAVQQAEEAMQGEGSMEGEAGEESQEGAELPADGTDTEENTELYDEDYDEYEQEEGEEEEELEAEEEEEEEQELLEAAAETEEPPSESGNEEGEGDEEEEILGESIMATTPTNEENDNNSDSDDGSSAWYATRSIQEAIVFGVVVLLGSIIVFSLRGRRHKAVIVAQQEDDTSFSGEYKDRPSVELT